MNTKVVRSKRTWIERLRRALRRESGQGMTEYIIIVALIAIAAIGVITVFGENIRELFRGSAQALTGDTNVSNDGIEIDHGSDLVSNKTLKNYAQKNAP